MKKFLISSIIIAILSGCSSSVPSPSLEQFREYSGGQSIGDASSFYWYTERQSLPFSASDYVSSTEYGWYKSSYRWDEGEVREVVREGQKLNNANLVPFKLHVRYNREGEAVYQQYRVDGKVLPLDENQLGQYQQEARAVAEKAKDQNKMGLTLIQGVWDGSTFESCDERQFTKVKFNQSLPSFVINRLASIDSYAAFLGKADHQRVTIDELLMLAEDDHGCVERPNLIEN